MSRFARIVDVAAQAILPRSAASVETCTMSTTGAACDPGALSVAAIAVGDVAVAGPRLLRRRAGEPTGAPGCA